VKRRHGRRRGQYNRVIFSAPASARVGTRKTFLASASVSSLCRRETLEYSEHGGNNNSRVFSDCIPLARDFGRRRLGERIYAMRSSRFRDSPRDRVDREINGGASRRSTRWLQSRVEGSQIFNFSNLTGNHFPPIQDSLWKMLSATDQGER